MLRDTRPQRALARIGQLLRSAKANVSKVAVAVSGKRPRAAYGKALNHHFRIWQRRRLFGHVFRGLNGAFCGLDCGVALPGFCDKQLQTGWRVLAESRRSPKDKQKEFDDLRYYHFSSHTFGTWRHTKTQGCPRKACATKKSDSKYVDYWRRAFWRGLEQDDAAMGDNSRQGRSESPHHRNGRTKVVSLNSRSSRRALRDRILAARVRTRHHRCLAAAGHLLTAFSLFDAHL